MQAALARKGHASDPKQDAAVQFACKVVGTRGTVTDADVRAVGDAGCADASVMGIVALVAMYPEKHFPAVTPAGSI